MGGRHGIYARRLRALHEATNSVRGLQSSGDVDGVAIAAERALDCVYDLHEAYFLVVAAESRNLAEKDVHLARHGGEVVGGLCFARGEKTHNIITPLRTLNYGEGVYGVGTYGIGAWVWTELTTQRDKFRDRASWYAEQVQGNRLHEPLEVAHAFFATRHPVGSAPCA